jgi:hypothetical protein
MPPEASRDGAGLEGARFRRRTRRIGAPSGSRGKAMIFTIEFDGERVACSSAHCVHRLMLQGWTLSDPAQADALVLDLAAERPTDPAGDDSLRRR